MLVTVGMWETRERFPRPVGRVGDRVLVFQAFHGCHFHSCSIDSVPSKARLGMVSQSFLGHSRNQEPLTSCGEEEKSGI